MNIRVLENIGKELDQIEKDYGVQILYACESGSRAWGFDSPDSDYDVRFIYLHRTEWYLKLSPGRDVIERTASGGELDMSGWDLKKTLLLLKKSNPPLLEWIHSPIVYRDDGFLVSRLRVLAEQEYFSSLRSMYHYYHMARGNYTKYLQGKDKVYAKKYFYVLRPILACVWLKHGLGIVPTEFIKLVNGVVTDPDLRTEIMKLFEEKRSGAEMRERDPIPVIDQFLDKWLGEYETLEGVLKVPQEREHFTDLDMVFKNFLTAVNGPRV